MNPPSTRVTRKMLKLALEQCTPEQHGVFAKMYGKFGFNDNIETVVDNMDSAKLKWAMFQVQQTIIKNQAKENPV